MNKNQIICPHCNKPCGLSNPFLMVIQPPGFKCKNCGKIAIKSQSYPDPKPNNNYDYWPNEY